MNELVNRILVQDFDRRENHRITSRIIALRGKIESLRVVMEGAVVKIGGRCGKRRGFRRKIRARGMFQEALVVFQEHRRVITTAGASSMSIAGSTVVPAGSMMKSNANNRKRSHVNSTKKRRTKGQQRLA